ncbi:MAG TPA: hypothetical protein DEO94_05155 [Cyanobacteria bacterium UBA11991]|nr:hypothetical protein [Cyanobacteriota bacterium]MDY6358088.1 hypothetical protein [Cyanobacteriota bacterium]MDY6364744.1 hypothetical protein [Cyanobacteriota bacterium]MDY6383114.1 hypothetical protein [Cyanobacteriota bacterium]HCB11508.1 hypothetical protein [Cyanobacteria bacterium UBA11991]
MQGQIIAPQIAEVSKSAMKFIKGEQPFAAAQAEKLAQEAKINKLHEYLSPSAPMPDPATIKPAENHVIDYYG